MSIVARLGAVLLDDLIEAPDKLWEDLGRNGGVLDEWQRLGVAGHVHHQAESCLPDVPDHRLLGGGDEFLRGVAEAALCHVSGTGIDLRLNLGRRLARELDDKEGIGAAFDEPGHPRIFQVGLGLVEDHAADVFHGCRVQFQHRDRGLHRFDQLVEVNDR